MEKVSVCGGDGCWLWTASLDSKGYAQISMNGRPTRASRVSYQLFKGPIPDGLDVLHTCDNPVCVRPCHLWTGTKKDNSQDMVRKGRHGMHVHPERCLRGSAVKNAKLNENKVGTIRLLLARNWPQRVVATFLGVSQATVNNVNTNKFWKHV